MNETYELLYQGLLRDTGLFWGTATSEIEKTERCFKCCMGYWERLKALIGPDAFPNDCTEIRFFKYIKPLFTGQLEFYTQVYQWLLFSPTEDPVEQLEYMQKDLRKIERFRSAHAAFLSYYESGAKDLDAQYFLRRNCDGENLLNARVYDMDLQTATTHDWILSQMRGYCLYRQFLELKIWRR